MFDNMDYIKVHGVPKSKFMWCLHCERVYRTGEYRQVEGLQLCPYPDCDGDAVIDAHEWSPITWPCEFHPEYPDEPKMGVAYPLYGPK